MLFNKPKYLIAGLGNPESKYDLTRHNIGFMAVDKFCKMHGIEANKKRFNSMYSTLNYKNNKIFIIKPLTYMNLSGSAIRDFSNYFNIPINNIIVICDDINLDIGKIRIRRKGSSGGHNGLKDIINVLGKDNFNRLRIGIGNNKDTPLIDYVLQRFNSEELPLIDEACKKSTDAILSIIDHDVDYAMNKFN